MSATAGPALPNHVLNSVFGTLLIGTWINSMVFALEATQIVRYWILFPSDRLWLKLMVAGMFAVDLAGTASICALCYTYIVTGWGDLVTMAHQNLNFAIYVCTAAIVVFTMHMFLIHRYLILSKNWVASVALGLTALTGLVGGMIVTWAVGVKYTDASDRPKQRVFTTIWLAASAAADILIAAALLVELGRVKSPLKRTRSLIRRLVRGTIMTGSFTAVFALVGLLLFVTSPSTNTCLIFSFPLGRVSTLTVLFNLNERGRSRNETSGTTSEGGNTLSLGTKTGPGHGRTTDGGISVHRDSVVHVDATAQGRSGSTSRDISDKRRIEMI